MRVIRYLQKAVLVFGIIPLLASAQAIRTEQELQALRARIGALSATLEEQSAEKQGMSRALMRIEREQEALTRREKQLENTLNEAERSLASTRTELAVLQRKYRHTLQKLGQFATASYALSNTDGLKLWLNQSDPGVAARSLIQYRYIMQAQRKFIADLQATRAELTRLDQQAVDMQSQIDGQLQEIAATRQQLVAKAAQRSKELARIAAKLSSTRKRLDAYQQREAELKLLLARVMRQKTAARIAQDAATETPAATGHSGGNDRVQPGGFAARRGRMPPPTSAKLRARFGQKRPESGLIWEGLMFAARPGQSVHAIHPGQVIFSDWFRGYGQLLIIDHGDGYMSLYGHNQSLSVPLGAVVDSGEQIAAAGDTGGLSQPGLYFEIRHNGQPDDPLKWLSR